MHKILDLGKVVNSAIRNESKVENIIPEFPIDDFEKLPVELRKKLDSSDDLDKIMQDYVFSLNVSETESAQLEVIAEAYLLKKVDDQIIKKFDVSLSTKMKEIKDRTLLRFSSKDKKDLRPEEISDYQNRINSY